MRDALLITRGDAKGRSALDALITACPRSHLHSSPVQPSWALPDSPVGMGCQGQAQDSTDSEGSTGSGLAGAERPGPRPAQHLELVLSSPGTCGGVLFSSQGRRCWVAAAELGTEQGQGCWVPAGPGCSAGCCSSQSTAGPNSHFKGLPLKGGTA